MGTSATIGSEKEIERLLAYVKNLFDEPFDTASVITEDRIGVSEYLVDSAIEYTEVPADYDKCYSNVL